MRAELMVLGKPVDMSLRARRRVLVMSIYATLLLGILLIAWVSRFYEAWQICGAYIVFLALMINRVLLGGYARGGLVRPFSNRETESAARPVPYVLLGLYLRLADSSDRSWRNDERELDLRDRAHYNAYQAISVALAILWLLTGSFANRILSKLHFSTGAMLYLVTLAAVLLAITLPQAILLWNEPDMVEFGSEP